MTDRFKIVHHFTYSVVECTEDNPIVWNVQDRRGPVEAIRPPSTAAEHLAWVNERNKRAKERMKALRGTPDDPVLPEFTRRYGEPCPEDGACGNLAFDTSPRICSGCGRRMLDFLCYDGHMG